MSESGREMYRSRTTEEARKALSAFCAGVGTHGDKHVHIFSIPVDQERDADMILSDVIVERDLLQRKLALAMKVVNAAKLTRDSWYRHIDAPGSAVHGPLWNAWADALRAEEEALREVEEGAK